MMTFWVNKIANDLWEFNNQIGSWEDYKYLAWSGIWTDKSQNDPCMLLFITPTEFAAYQTRYNDNIMDNPNTLVNQESLNNCMNNK